VCISTIRTASNVRSRVRDARLRKNVHADQELTALVELESAGRLRELA
jgi:hypothetical protein